MYVSIEKRKPTMGKIILHSVLVILTGGLWLIPLIVRALLK